MPNMAITSLVTDKEERERERNKKLKLKGGQMNTTNMFQNVSHTIYMSKKKKNPTKCFSHPNFLLKKNISILIYIIKNKTYKIIQKSTLQVKPRSQGDYK